MKDTKLVMGLRTLSKKEWMSFRKFLLMNTGIESENYSLFQHLQTKKNDLVKLGSPEEFRIKYFPKINQRAFFGLLSKVYKWFEEWLVYHELKNTEYQKDILLVESLFKKGLIKEAGRKTDKIIERLHAEEGIDFEINQHLSRINHIIYYNKNEKSTLERNEVLVSASESMAKAFKELGKFYIAELNNRAVIYGTDFSKTVNMLQKSGDQIQDTQLAKLGTELTKLTKERNLESLKILQEAMFSDQFKSQSAAKEIALDYLVIFTRKLYMSGQFNNHEVIIKLQDYHFENITNNPNKQIAEVSFHNAVDYLANFVTVDRTKEFVDRWVEKVNTPHPKETKDLAYSQIYFIARDFTKMLEYSRFIAFQFHGQKTRAWLHNVICHFVFRKEDYELAIQSLASFKKYIIRNRKKSSKFYTESHINLISIMEKLMKNDYKKQDISLDEYKHIFYRTWITEEVNKTKKK